MKAFDQGTLMTLQDVVERIGCESVISADHKSDWLDRRLGLRPAGRIALPGRKRTSLVWREADVDKAAGMFSRQMCSGTRGVPPLAQVDPSGASFKEFSENHILKPLRGGLGLYSQEEVEAIVRFHAADSGRALV